MNKKLNIFAYAISIAGIWSELSALIQFPYEAIPTVRTAGVLLKALSLMLFRADYLYYDNSWTTMRVNYLSLAAYCLLLIGAIAWSVSKGKETRLVRAILALIIFQQGLFFISNIAYGVIYFKEYMDAAIIWSLMHVVSIIEHAVLCLFLFRALDEYQQTRKLETDTPIAVSENETTAEVAVSTGLVYAPLLKRFANVVVDTVLCLLVFVPFAETFQMFLGPLEYKYGDNITIYAFLFIGRLIYYPFFETLFGATPAKLFTGTRVVLDENDKGPSFGRAMYRTLCRFIPFEPFSFFFSVTGWHDNFTNTRVVNEERTGVRLRVYGIIIPSIIVLVSTTAYYANKAYEKNKSYAYYEESHKKKIDAIQKHLAKLDTAHIIQLRDLDNPYSFNDIFLKIEEINSDRITAYVIIPGDRNSKSIRTIENLYMKGKAAGSLFVAVIDRSDLEKAYTEDYYSSGRNDRNSIKPLKDNRRFEIESIDRLFGPTIHDSRMTSVEIERGIITFGMLNAGWPGTIVSLETLEGTIKWPKTRDISAPALMEKVDAPTFAFSGEDYDRGDLYKFKMIVRDTLGRDFTYIVEGRNANMTVEMVE